MIVYPFFTWHLRLVWTISREERNRCMHSYNGNPRGKGRVHDPKGRGKGKGLTPQVPAPNAAVTDFGEDVVAQARRVLPQAAIL